MMIYFNYLLLYFMTGLFKQEYIIGLCSAISEIFAYAIAGIPFLKLGIHKTYLLCLSLALLGGIFTICFGLDN